MVTYRRFEVYAFLYLSHDYKWMSRDWYEEFCTPGYDMYSKVSLTEIEDWVLPRLGGDKLIMFLRKMQYQCVGYLTTESTQA